MGGWRRGGRLIGCGSRGGGGKGGEAFSCGLLVLAEDGRILRIVVALREDVAVEALKLKRGGFVYIWKSHDPISTSPGQVRVLQLSTIHF